MGCACAKQKDQERYPAASLRASTACVFGNRWRIYREVGKGDQVLRRQSVLMCADQIYLSVTIPPTLLARADEVIE